MESTTLTDYYARTRIREYSVALELAWGGYFERHALEYLTADSTDEMALLLRRIGLTLRQRAKQQIRCQQLTLTDGEKFTLEYGINPPVVVRQLVRNQVGVQFIYGHRETASRLADWFIEQTGEAADPARSSYARDLQHQTENAFSESYQPDPEDYLPQLTEFQARPSKPL